MGKMMFRCMTAGSRLALPALIVATASSLSAWADGSPGAVYALTNASANAVAVYERGPMGTLTPAGTYLTNGQGTGGGLGSQGAIALSEDGRWLVAVNPASDDVTLFSVGGHGLEFRGKVPSGGQRPISVDNHDDLVYIVNAGGIPSVSGFC